MPAPLYIEGKVIARRDAANGIEIWAKLYTGYFVAEEVDGVERQVFRRVDVLREVQRGFDPGTSDAAIRDWLSDEMAQYPEYTPLW